MREEWITLPAKVGIETIALLYQETLKRLTGLNPGDSLLLDFTLLEHFDTSLGQLLQSLKKTAALKKINLDFDGIEPHKNICAMLNCDSLQETSRGGSA